MSKVVVMIVVAFTAFIVAGSAYVITASNPATRPGYYGEVVGQTPNGSMVKFFHLSVGGSPWYSCNMTLQLRGIFQSNQTFLYFENGLNPSSITAFNATATQNAYRYGSVCP